MKDTIVYLNRVFDSAVTIKDFEQTAQLPMYLVRKFHFKKVTFEAQKNQYFFIKPKETLEIKIDPLKKQLEQIQKHTGCVPVLVFSALRLSQRNALIRASIPFVVPFNQLFLPNVIINLSEKEILAKEYAAEFAVPTQVVFIYLLLNDITETNARRLSEELPYSVATMNRSLAELVSRELLYTKGTSTRKKYKRINKKEYWQNGKAFLFNPVQKTYHVKHLSTHLGLYMSNETALGRLSSSLNPGIISYYAASPDTIKQLATNNFVNDYDIFDYHYYVIEQFKYDPQPLNRLISGKSQYIDIISLYAQFKNTPDERIQIALDELLGEIL